jgi:UDP-N-acetylmuramoyl-tripeptide--D-alanyl-D-alanine ligase
MVTSRDLSDVVHVEFRNKGLLRGKKILGVSTDSRKTKAGDVFIALRGENFDGHAFVADAFERGAVAAIVDQNFAEATQLGKPLLVVEDTTRALGELAHMHRKKFDIPVLAIGGSNGKTTTKDMISSVLSTKYNVLKTAGNLNNHIGVPETLLQLQKKHDIAAVEIGTNHPGEIEYLCGILEPTHGLITNTGREHLEFFKSVDGVAEEEGKLFDYLKSKPGSTAFVNGDDQRIRKKARGMKKCIVYGMQTKSADVRGKIVDVDETGCASFEYVGKRSKKSGRTKLGIPGEHNAQNALAAVAVGLAFKVSSKAIRGALESFRSTTKRMEVLDLDGVIVYNDTYNANPDSMISALRTLASAKVSGKKIAVLADMRELGDASKEEHALVGREATRLKIDYVLTFGELARAIHDAATVKYAIHYDQKNMLAEYLSELISPGDALLVKGSRGMKMEDIVTFLQERLRPAVVTPV